MSDKMAVLFCSMLGQVVDVTVKDGDAFRGILSSIKSDDPQGMGCNLRMARKLHEGVTEAELDKMKPIESIIILPKDFVQLVAVNTYLGGERGTGSKAFQTDSSISGKELHERELVMWDGGGEIELDAEWMERAGKTGLDSSGKWDQFAANEDLFGVECKFDEELYTTKLNTSSMSQDQIAHAARLAAEIEGTEDGNIQRMMDRKGDNVIGDFSEEASRITRHHRNLYLLTL